MVAFGEGSVEKLGCSLSSGRVLGACEYLTLHTCTGGLKPNQAIYNANSHKHERADSESASTPIICDKSLKVLAAFS